ncbi:hypothetical protein [Microbacterium laevaniformans]|uniref:hypothetical protein n=1 Tax=Microbacterium laevaniformans TaxID=36807 RepID=UPI003634EA8C
MSLDFGEPDERLLPFAASHSESLRSIYSEMHDVKSEVVITDHNSHSMGDSLDRYVDMRVDGDLLDWAKRENLSVGVEGIYPNHLGDAIRAGSLTPLVSATRRRRWANGIRALYARSSGDRLMVFVAPGRDYVIHNAELIASYMQRRNDSIQTVTYYPKAESSVATWTRLLGFQLDRLVIIGYSDLLLQLLLHRGASIESRQENEYYVVVRARFAGGASFTLLSVRFSYWGSMARHLASSLLRAGAETILYCAKLGTIDPGRSPYDGLYIPTRYFIGGQSGRSYEVVAPMNPVAEAFPALATGPHLTVATMMRETRELVSSARSLHICSVDNEIGEIAYAFAAEGAGRGFSAIHFATDSPAGLGDQRSRSSDLTTSRTSRDRASRDRSLDEVANVLFDFLRMY